MTSNLPSVCNSVQQISNCEKLRRHIFCCEMETQLTEKPLRGNQTQDIHYSEDKASYKAVALTYPYTVIVP
jgi:hypothetical protein